MPSVLQPWITELPLQQQAVLILCCRGPDGFGKWHACKDITRALRGSVMCAAHYGRPLHYGEKAGTFMSLELIADQDEWAGVLKRWADVEDGLPIHFWQHCMQAANVLRVQHPDSQIREARHVFYIHCCDYIHMEPETHQQMLARLNDFGNNWNVEG